MPTTKKVQSHHISKDVFLHLLVIVALYFSAASFLTLLFQLINLNIPDPLQDHYYKPVVAAYGPLRFALASLLIVFPGFMGVSWFLQRAYQTGQMEREWRFRKWLIHFTLFATAIIIGGDLVSLIYNYLDGELTVRFLLKSLAVLVVAGTIFSYYLWDGRLRYFAWPVTVVVVIGMVVGFMMVDSPLQERLYRLDEQRIQDLQMIQNYIDSYWQQAEELPASLTELQTEFGESTEYTYKQTNATNYSLCATFLKPSRSEVDTYSLYTWEHNSGYVCFDRTVTQRPEGVPLLQR